MKKNYLLPRQNVVEIDEEEMLCTSPEGDTTPPISVELNDYSTYQAAPRSSSAPVEWDGVGTGSDF